MPKKGPGKSHRKGISIYELGEMFPTEESAERWFEKVRWSKGRHCPHCGNTETRETKNRKPMPYWCGGCRSYFSVRTGTPIQRSKLPLRKWVFAVYLYVTNLKGVSSMKLHRDLGVTQKTAWFMLHRLRAAWDQSGLSAFTGPAEADETYMGGLRKNTPAKKRKLRLGSGTAGKTVVVGVKSRNPNLVHARVVPDSSKNSVMGFVQEAVKPGAILYTDEGGAYRGGIPYDHETVNHKAGEYVRGQVHTQGIESFWSMLKRAHKGTFHQISDKHLQRYVDEFVGRHRVRDRDTLDQMRDVIACSTGKRLLYRDLVN